MTTPTTKETDAQQEWRWKVESAASTLIEAEKIKKDKKLMTAVRQELKKKLEETKQAVKKI